MELRQIKYFIEVAKMEHVTAAAVNLHVAQSAVSRQIANLEEELNVKLFQRDGRNVKLTPVGKVFLEHVELALLEIDHAVEKIHEFLNPETGVIRIGFPNSLSANTLPVVISSFRHQYPNISLQVQQGSLKYLLAAVQKGSLNVAFVTPVPMNEKDVTGKIFFTENMVALLPRDHLYAERESIRLDELRNDPFVLFRTGLRRNLILHACQQSGFEPEIAFEGEDIDTIKNLIAAGIGVGLLPETTVSQNIPRDTMTVRVSEPNINRTVGVIVSKNRAMSPSERLLVDFLNDFYEKLTQFGR
ncbi:MAG TPA: LysR family transcriptional regulator [Bacillales bacterium]|nr:LysR family transcriptional regulator [Bacillales bacterium]